jgi:Sec-independent protein secretion pathway component TatC
VGGGAPAAPRLSILEIPLTVLGGISQVYRLSEYISFVLLLLAGTVIAFQMPLVVLLLGWVGIVSPEFLRSKRKVAVFIMAIVAAIVTPSTDPGTMLMMLLPLWMLYEFGILLLVFVPSHKVAQGRVFSFRRTRGEPDESDGGWGGSSR